MTRIHLFLRAAVSVAALLIAPAFGLTGANAQILEVPTASGPLVGISRGGVHQWLGIPYAAPPVGPLRWQPPQPAKPWTAPIKANTLPSSCAQSADLGAFARAGGTEDCLYLNVYRSADKALSGTKLPVFVWLHGGALQVGQGADYDPTKLVVQGNTMVVTLNYRLGLFGFFAHPAIDREGHPFGNYGLLDQQAALRWVQQNIGAFGGDPQNVTIAGESSGGNSVMLQVASPLAAGTFQKGVVMSGAGVMTRHPAFGAPRPLNVAQQLGVEFASSVGCTSDIPTCLRALPAKRILDAHAPFILNEAILDGRVIPMHPSDAYRTGEFNQVPLINGITRDEGRFFVALPELETGRAMTAADYPVWMDRQYGKQLVQKVLREYPLSAYETPSAAFAAAVTDSMFACTARAMNRVLGRHVPVHAYEFSDQTAPSYVGPTTFPLLAAHTLELPYLFPGFRGGGEAVVKLNPLQEKLSDEMVGYFANVGQLSAGVGEWTRYDAQRDNVMTFSLPKAGMVDGKYADFHHCGFWDRTGVY